MQIRKEGMDCKECIDLALDSKSVVLRYGKQCSSCYRGFPYTRGDSLGSSVGEGRV